MTGSIGAIEGLSANDFFFTNGPAGCKALRRPAQDLIDVDALGKSNLSQEIPFRSYLGHVGSRHHELRAVLSSLQSIEVIIAPGQPGVRSLGRPRWPNSSDRHT